MKGDKIKKFILDNTFNYSSFCTCEDCRKANIALKELDELERLSILGELIEDEERQ